jgi:hypothetical protein
VYIDGLKPLSGRIQRERGSRRIFQRSIATSIMQLTSLLLGTLLAASAVEASTLNEPCAGASGEPGLSFPSGHILTGSLANWNRLLQVSASPHPPVEQQAAKPSMAPVPASAPNAASRTHAKVAQGAGGPVTAQATPSRTSAQVHRSSSAARGPPRPSALMATIPHSVEADASKLPSTVP